MASAQAWRQHVETWQASGLTQAAYCRQQGLNPHTFNGWRRRFTATPATSPGVIPIRVSPTAPAPAAAVVLRLASGHQVELPASTAPAWLAELLRCLV